MRPVPISLKVIVVQKPASGKYIFDGNLPFYVVCEDSCGFSCLSSVADAARILMTHKLFFIKQVFGCFMASGALHVDI